MSSPATPLAPGAAEPVPPVERERLWWTPLALAIDRWLQPRWRALLTWAVFAVATGLALGPVEGWLFVEKGVEFTLSQVEALIGVSIPHIALSFAEVPTVLALFCWYQPVVLRVGVWRTLIWIGASILLGCGAVMFSMSRAFQNASMSGAAELAQTFSWLPRAVVYDLAQFVHNIPVALVYGHFLGIPGLAIVGRRSRPWLSSVAGLLATALVFAMFSQSSAGLTIALASILYGAVMIYGTSPLPRSSA